MQKLLTNRPAQIAIAVVLILAVVYFMGRKAGIAKATEPSWWQKLLGITPNQGNPTNITVNGQEPLDNVQYVTDALYHEMQLDVNLLVGGWYSDGQLDKAFGQFNALSASGKATVLNDWNARYYGKDRPGVFTGDMGTLRTEILYLYPDSASRPQETGKALAWMQLNKIN